MNLKLILGIVMPLVVIISLIVLSSSNAGFYIEKETEKSLSYNSVFTSQNQAGEVKIQTITLKNDYFLPKKIEMPKIIVCLYDAQGKIKSQNLYVRYNEGKTSEIPKSSVFGELQSISRAYDYGYYTATRIVDIPAHSKKELKLMVQPKNIYNNYDYNNKNSEAEFDEVLIIEPKEDKDNYYSYYNSYDSCANLHDKDIDSAIHIKIEIPFGNLQSEVDISKCYLLQDQAKDSCIYSIAQFNLNVKSSGVILKLCDIIIDKNSRNLCYINAAGKYGDVGICSNILNNYTANEITINNVASTVSQCYSAIATNSGNVSVCYKMPEQLPGTLFSSQTVESQKNTCIVNFAGSKGNVELCQSIADEGLRNSCYLQIASNFGNLNVCDNITANSNLKDTCIAWAGNKLRDKSVCSTVKDENLRKYCLGIT
ncbi:hypothetical protein HYX00_04985 [Candidatus Woesearchaeota archaeon]|nr:hypothetical protein [Candidatus Woesearchaeota archaeon]